jgi:hypothetical protein
MSADEDALLAEKPLAPWGPVPGFFQDEGEPALRLQVRWLERHLGFTDQFFAKFLDTTESSFRDWRVDRAALSPDRQSHLGGLWQTVLHLLSFMNLDEKRIRTLLDHQVPPDPPGVPRHYLVPPWRGSTLRSYLEERGPGVLVNVDRWREGFKFGNPYSD